MSVSFMMRGQRYDYVHTEPHTRRDGVQIALMVFHSECPDCGDGFLAKMPFAGEVTGIRRRCDVCKAPGKPVKKASPK